MEYGYQYERYSFIFHSQLCEDVKILKEIIMDLLDILNVHVIFFALIFSQKML